MSSSNTGSADGELSFAIAPQINASKTAINAPGAFLFFNATAKQSRKRDLSLKNKEIRRGDPQEHFADLVLSTSVFVLKTFGVAVGIIFWLSLIHISEPTRLLSI